MPVAAPTLVAAVQRQPGAIATARSATLAQYRLPQLAREEPLPQADGLRTPVEGLASACAPRDLVYATDGDSASVWECTPGEGHALLTLDLGEVRDVSRIVHSVGRRPEFTPDRLEIETSADGTVGRPAWSGRPIEETIVAGLTTPGNLRIVVGFPARRARVIRLSGAPREPGFPWVIAELEVWSGRDASPDP